MQNQNLTNKHKSPCSCDTGDTVPLSVQTLSAGRKAPALPAGALCCISYDLLTCRYLLSLLSRFRRKRSQPQKLVPIAIEMICLTVRTFSIVRLGISFTLSRHPSIQTKKKQGTKIKNFFIGVIFAFSIVIYSFTNLKIFAGCFGRPAAVFFVSWGRGFPFLYFYYNTWCVTEASHHKKDESAAFSIKNGPFWSLKSEFSEKIFVCAYTYTQESPSSGFCLQHDKSRLTKKTVFFQKGKIFCPAELMTAGIDQHRKSRAFRALSYIRTKALREAEPLQKNFIQENQKNFSCSLFYTK